MMCMDRVGLLVCFVVWCGFSSCCGLFWVFGASACVLLNFGCVADLVF